jgi:hypothetical protein
MPLLQSHCNNCCPLCRGAVRGGAALLATIAGHGTGELRHKGQRNTMATTDRAKLSRQHQLCTSTMHAPL